MSFSNTLAALHRHSTALPADVTLAPAAPGRILSLAGPETPPVREMAHGGERNASAPLRQETRHRNAASSASRLCRRMAPGRESENSSGYLLFVKCDNLVSNSFTKRTREPQLHKNKQKLTSPLHKVNTPISRRDEQLYKKDKDEVALQKRVPGQKS